ncbi:MAG: complex I subunit 5 family protein [Anaerolineaceae bacterium]
MSTQLLSIGLIAIPLVAAPFIYLLGRTSVRKQGVFGMSLAKVLTLLVLLVEGLLLFLGTRVWMTGGTVSTIIGSVLIGLDGIGLIVSAIAVGLGFCVVLFSIPYMAHENGEEKFYALLLILIGSIVGLGCAMDLFNLWVWFELMAISSYFLVAFYNEQPASLEAGFKYLTQSAVGSALVLFGLAMLFSATGSMDFGTLWSTVATGSPIVLAATALIVIGFGIKAALVPLHTWLPDAHSQAPSGISAMLSGIVIEAGLIAMLRTLSVLAHTNFPTGIVLLVFGCVNILVGNLLALRQVEVKRMLAYSSIAQVGYMLVGFGVAVLANSYTAAAGGFFHMFTHAMMKGLAFLAAGAFLYVLHIGKGDHGALVLDDLNGAAKKYPLVAFLFSAALLGLGGLPPMAGFMSKWVILISTAQVGSVLMLCIVIFVALNSVLSLGYYVPLINRMYRLNVSETVAAGKPIQWLMVAPMIILIIGIIAVGVWPPLANFLSNNAAASFMYPFGV